MPFGEIPLELSRVDPLLAHGVALANGHAVILQRIEIDGDTEWRADLISNVARFSESKHEKAIGRGESFAAVERAEECNILCFRYLGDGNRSDDELDRLNFDLRQRYNRSGEGWITTTVLDGRRVLRTTIMNPRTTEEHLVKLLEGLERTARDL